MSTAMPTAERLKEWLPDMFQEIFGGDLKYCRMNMPWALAKEQAETVHGRMRIRIRAGADDPKKAGCEQFHELLTALKIEHDFALIPKAGHNLAEMYQQFEGDPFKFFGEVFGDLANCHTGTKR